MGVGDSKAKFEHGHIIVQTDKPYYAPGENITGNIYLYLEQPFPGNRLEIELSGKEKVSWIVRRNRNDRDYDNSYETVKVKDDVKVLDYKYPMYTFPNQAALAGQYTFPFSIQLPYEIPSSCTYAEHGQSRAHGDVKYKLKASMVPYDQNKVKPMKFKQVLIVRQLPKEEPESTHSVYSDQVNTWCCWCSSGTVKLETQLDKTAYLPNEVVKIIAKIDNSNCTKDINKIEVSLVQHVRLVRERKFFDAHDTGEYNTQNILISKFLVFTKIYLAQEYPGIGKGESTKGMTRFMELDLSGYQGKFDKDDYPDEFQDKDDIYMARGVQPNVQGKLVKIYYSLRVTLDYNTCCVCSVPWTDKSIFIAPPQLPSYQKIQAPSGWNPQVFDPIDMAAPVPTKELNK